MVKGFSCAECSEQRWSWRVSLVATVPKTVRSGVLEERQGLSQRERLVADPWLISPLDDFEPLGIC